MNIPKHKRFLYSNTGLTVLNVGVIQESNIHREIEKWLSMEEILKLNSGGKSCEQIFEHTFRYATKFEGWLDADWINE